MAGSTTNRAQSSEGTDYKNSNSCVACDRPDSADDFVCCDKCDEWWHFSCAGVSSSVENRDWVCTKCLKAPSVVLSKSASVKTTSSTRKARIELQLKQLEEQRELDRKALDLELEKKFLADKYQLLEQTLLDEEDDRRSVRTRSSQKEAAKEALERVKHVAEWVKKSQAEKGLTESAPIVTPTNIQNAIPDVVRTDEDEGAVGGKPSFPPSAHPNRSKKVDSSGESENPANKNALHKLQKQLRECQLGSQPTLQQLAELQKLVESCKLQISAQGASLASGVGPEANPDCLKGAIPRTDSTKQANESRLKFSAPRSQKDTTLDPQNNCAFEQTENRATGQQQNLTPKITPLMPPNVWSQERLSRITNQLDEEIAALRPNNPNALCASKQTRYYTETSPECRFPSVPHPVGIPVTAPEAPRVETARQTSETRFQAPGVEAFRRAPSPARPSALGGIQVREPTSQQLAARQVLPRELPIFSGNPADWPVFFSNYKYTTEACGYSHGENMIRLQRCLKGAALETVRSRLLLPASVPQVIETLKMRYGRAELLIDSLIEKVRSAPSPRSDRLETLIDFGQMVQALCDHIVAADLQDHLANPSLLKDMVNKLPSDYRMQWAGYRRHQNVVNLKTFGEFMEEIVRDACSVTSVQIYEPIAKPDRSKMRDRHLVHSETGGSETTNEYTLITQVDEVTKPLGCAVCQKEGHRARDCHDFLALSVNDRWRKVQELKLCRTCLFGHGRRPCRSTQRCEVDGCQTRHHRLLHSSPKEKDSNASEVSESVQHHLSKSIAPALFFRILPVTLHSGGKSVKTYAFLDEGSSLTMIEKNLAVELGVTGYAKPLCLKWTSNVTHEEQDSLRVAFEVSGEDRGKRYKIEDVGTIETLDLPTQSVPIEKLVEGYKHLRGLPIKGYQGAVPQLLIGVDNLRLIVPLKVHEGPEGSPTATKTRLGWCLYGGQRSVEHQFRSYHVCECGGDTAFDEAIKKYFSFEEDG